MRHDLIWRSVDELVCQPSPSRSLEGEGSMRPVFWTTTIPAGPSYTLRQRHRSRRMRRRVVGPAVPPRQQEVSMTSLLQCLRAIRDDENGATAIEYGLIAALIAVAAVATMTT